MGNDDYKQRLKNTGRNDLCLCGSGRKYKKCHLEEDEASERADLKAAASEREKVSAESGSEEQSSGRENKWRNESKKIGKARSGSDTHPNIPRRGAI